MKTRKTFLAYFLVLMSVGFLTPLAVRAQSDQSRIAGTVVDSSGGAIAGASVIVKNEKTGEERTVIAREDGTFQVVALKPTTYTVSGTANNFQTFSQKGIELLVGQEANVTLTLQPTGVTAQVDIVGGEESAINTASASIGVNVTPREVASLPLNGRQVSQLYLQTPGSVNSGSGTFSDIRFNARAVEQNIIRYDGIEGTAVIDASPGNLNGEIASPFRLQSSLENVQEFRVESSNFPAEFGTGTGGQISLITKSGGNAFHGSLFEYFRNDKLDAANFFDNIAGSKSPLRLNQFGGSLGGPIIKNKLFFFGSYEGYRLSAGINSVEAVPGETARICAVANCNETIGGVVQTSRTIAALPAFRDPRAVIISRGTGTNLFDVAQLQGNQKVTEDAYSLRLDYKPTENNTFYLRAFRDNGNNLQPEGVSGRTLNFVANPQNAVVSWQSIISPNLINEAKVGYNSAFTRTNGIARSIPGFDLSAAAINISGNTANFSIAGQGTAAGTSNPGGLIRANSAANGRGQPYTAYSVSFIDNLTYIRGDHNMKFGVEIRPVRIYTDRNGGTTFVFNSLTDYLANNLASVQYQGDLSDPSPFNNGLTGNRLAKQEYYIAYAQDEWKIRQNLTLNYGLRYEFYTPLREDKNGQVLFNISDGTFRPSSEAAFKTDKKAFGPRVGLTYSPNLNSDGFFGGGKSVFRGGFGVYYGPGQVEDQIQPIESDRINATLQGSATVRFDPNIAGFVNTIRTNFISNPNNRQYQPRAYAPEYLVPERIFSFTGSYQQELPYKITATVAYVGSRGRNLFLRGLSNTIRGGNATILNGAALPTNAGVINRTDAAGRVIGITTLRQFDILNGDAVTACNAPTALAVCRPFAEVDFKTSGGTDKYDALQIAFARRIGNGVTLNAQYTFSKSFGNTSGSNEARTTSQPFGGEVRESGDYNNYEAERGANNFDVRNTFNFSAIYDLPFGRGKRYDLGSIGNAFLGDWEIGTIVNARSGVPIDITITRPDTVIVCQTAGGCIVPNNAAGTSTTTYAQGFTANVPTVSGTSPLPPGFIAVINAPGGGSSRQTRRPNFVSGVNPYLGEDRNFLNPAAFAAPAAGTFGDVPRNALIGPSFRQLDVILNKRFRFNERFNLEFRTEIFNILNRANFGNPASVLANPLPSFTTTAATATTPAFYALNSGFLQPGQPLTQTRAGSAFGLLRSTVERTVGLGTNRQIQFALRLNF
ncbi:MAG: carboxypeptidase regulatory-like domain-containing protein [Pyrinomonadaceae bacterium]